MKAKTAAILRPQTEFTPRPPLAGRHKALAALVLLVVVMVLFGDVLFFTKGEVLSLPGTDVTMWFLTARQFGFEQLAHGHLALWNPHIYGGVPFFGNVQSALLYPPNLIFLGLPLHTAINVSMALHVLLLGLFMLAWSFWRGLSVYGSLLAALLAMFGGTFFLHIYAGHLSNLCTMAWAPLLLLAVDGCLERPHVKWVLLGMPAVAMMVLAGHLQYVLFTAVIVAVYIVLRVIGLLRKQVQPRGGGD